MDIDSDSSAESLRKLVQLAKLQKSREKLCIFLGLAVIALPVVYLVTDMKPRPAPKADPLSWRDVNMARQEANPQKALKKANELLARNPLDAQGLYQRGEILLMLGDRDGARASFQQAYEIFPIDGYKRAVDALGVPEN